MSELSQSLVDAAAEAVSQSEDRFLALPVAEHVKLDPYAMAARATEAREG